MNVEATYRRFFPIVREHCRRLTGPGHDAEDLAQESFVRLLGAPRLPTERAMVAWLYRVSANLAVDRFRQTSRRRLPLTAVAPEAAPSTEANITLRQVVTQLVQTEGAEVVEAGLLARANGLTQVELAEVLGVSERTARRRLASFDAAAARLQGASHG